MESLCILQFPISFSRHNYSENSSMLFHVSVAHSLFTGEQYSTVQIYQSCLSIHLAMNICIASSFWPLQINMKKMCVPVLWGHMLSFLLSKSRSGITGSYCKCMFNMLRNCQTVFQSSCQILHSHQLYTRVLVLPNPSQQFICF